MPPSCHFVGDFGDLFLRVPPGLLLGFLVPLGVVDLDAATAGEFLRGCAPFLGNPITTPTPANGPLLHKTVPHTTTDQVANYFLAVFVGGSWFH